MNALLILLSAFIPKAHAALEQVGNRNAGVANMWAVICQTLPFCGTSVNAANAPEFFAGKVIAIIQGLITAVAVIMIIYASVQLSTSQLNEGKVEEAKKIIMYAVGGLILAVVAGTFVQYVLGVVIPQLFN